MSSCPAVILGTEVRLMLQALQSCNGLVKITDYLHDVLEWFLG